MKPLVVAATLFVFLGFCSCGRSVPEQGQTYYFVDHLNLAEKSFDEARFRSFRKNEQIGAPISLADVTMSSLIPPFPSRLSFDLQVPDEAMLQFALGVKMLGEPSHWPPVEFRLSVDSQGETETPFSEVLRFPLHDQWQERQVDLSAWAGSAVQIVFETQIGRSTDRVPWTARLILPAWGNPVLTGPPVNEDPPNLILISIDALRADHVGAYGYERDTTPNIDRFAGESVVFETAFSTAPWTLTSHMSMLTGLMPSMHGATRTAHLADTVPYLPELLSGAGYQVDGLVSNAYLSQTFRFDRGFRTYRVRPGDRTNEQIDEALQLVRRAQGRSQFLFLHLLGPHWPYLPPKDFIGRFGARPRDISGLLDLVLYRKEPGGSEEIQELKDLYDSEVAYVDRELGRFFDKLEDLGLYESSLIIVTSDHGEAFYEHGYWQHSDTLYEEMIRVPLIVKWPGHSQSRNVNSPVSLIDIFLTLAAEAGLSSPSDGAQDLRLRMQDESPVDDQRWVVSEVSWDPDPVRGLVSMFALRSGDLKYIATVESQPDLSGAKIYRENIYDLSGDPSENVDLMASGDIDPEVFRRTLLDYLSAARQFRAGHQGASVTLDDVTRERLKSLGYIEE